MKPSALFSSRRPLAALGAGAVLALALSGCMPGETPKVQDPAPAAPESSSAPAQPRTEAERGGDASQEPTAQESEAKAPAAAGKLTEPGTALKIGETAFTHSNSGEKGTEKYKEATYETTVTKIVKGSEDDLKKFKDAAKYAGQTPYYLFAEHKLTSLNKPSAGISDPRIVGHLSDGTEAQRLIVMGSFAPCKSTRFETEGKDDTFSYTVGSVKTDCVVFLAPTGDSVTSASYEDSSFQYESYGDNPYRDNPVTWK